MTYNERYHIQFGSYDGRRYRLSLQQAGYVGSPSPLTGTRDVCLLEVGTAGSQGVWENALTPQRMTITLLTTGEDLTPLFSVSPEEWYVELKLLDDIVDPVLWWGYLSVGRFRQSLYRTGEATLEATGFLQTIVDKDFVPTGQWVNLTQTLAKMFKESQAQTTPKDSGIATLTNYYPWLKGAVATGEPLEFLQVRDTVWEEAELGEVVRSICYSLGLEIFTSEGYIWIINRGALIDKLVIPNFASTNVRTVNYSNTWGSHNSIFGLSRDLDTYRVEYSPFDKESQPPEAIHRTSYLWEPPITSLLSNSNFNLDFEGNVGTSIFPLNWDVRPAVIGRPRYTDPITSTIVRARRAFAKDILSGQYTSSSNNYALQVASEDPNEALGIAASQQMGIKITGDKNVTLGVRCQGRIALGGFDIDLDTPVYVSITDGATVKYFTRNAFATTNSNVSGDKMLFNVVNMDGLGLWGSGAVTGTIIVPKGMTLYSIGNVHQITLVEDLKVGDTILYASVEEDFIPSGVTWQYWMWQDQRRTIGFDMLPAGTVSQPYKTTTEALAPLITPQGNLINGLVFVEVWQKETDNPDTSSANAGVYTAYTDISILTGNGAEVSTIRGVEVTATITGERGIRQELQNSTLGDGPTFENVSALRWKSGSIEQFTLQTGTYISPSVAGWKRGQYANTSEASTGVTLEELKVRDAGRQMSGLNDMIYATLVLRPTDPIVLPHHVCYIEGAWRWRTYYRWNVASGRLDLQLVTLNSRSVNHTITRKIL